MHLRWSPVWLTILQAFLAGAFPAPRFFGWFRRPNPNFWTWTHDSYAHEILTSSPLYSGVVADSSIDSSVASTPSPSGDPSATTSPGYTSAITFVDPHLSIQTVNVTSLPSSQVPTVTSANQSSPDTTGVSPFVANWTGEC